MMKTILKIMKYVTTASMVIAGGVIVGLTTTVVENIFNDAIEKSDNTKEG